MATSDRLFHDFDVHSALMAQHQKMIDEINGMGPDYLLNASTDAVCDYLEDKYAVVVPRLQDDGVTVDFEDEEQDGFDPFSQRPYKQMGTRYTFFVAFQGDSTLFKGNPSRGLMYPPRAEIRPNELVFRYFRPYMGTPDKEREAELVRTEFDGDLGQVKDLLGTMESDVRPFNTALREQARQQIEFRKAKFLRDKGVGTSLGFPLHKREGAPVTYSVPVVRKRLPTRPKASSTPFEPEPELAMDDYEHILRVITGMVTVMEQSPKAFVGMGEEDLRTHFLVQLNGQYQGEATGETFNFDGKTDILIRVMGRNIFIAECKFWRGAKAFRETIDQLLGYASWRDTKTAIILFNRNKDFSSVLKQIPETVVTHPNFRRNKGPLSETQFRYAFAHRDDPTRELWLTVLAFEVPV